ncbi:hypothetical protein GCM10009539_05030 [Cryptosporangium japonicum]|uniref:Uncharacterized protein n=1 Tax=Cryptosporangium japonicum TaxID=80872 RepID=A0ABP3D539_9ACTN
MLVIGGLLGPAARSARAASTVELDVIHYCQSIGYTAGIYRGGDAYDWWCARPGASARIDMADACRREHGNRAIDRLDDFRIWGSWGCWITEGLAGDLNLNASCQSVGYARAELRGTTAYDWRCVRGRTVSPIDTWRACQDFYGEDAIDRPADYRKPSSWQCWK